MTRSVAWMVSSIVSRISAIRRCSSNGGTEYSEVAELHSPGDLIEIDDASVVCCMDLPDRKLPIQIGSV